MTEPAARRLPIQGVTAAIRYGSPPRLTSGVRTFKAPLETRMAYVRHHDGLAGSVFIVSCQARALQAYTSANRQTMGTISQPVRAASSASRPTPVWATS